MMMNMDKHPKIILLDSGLCSAGEKGFGMISLIPGMRMAGPAVGWNHGPRDVAAWGWVAPKKNKPWHECVSEA